LLLLQVTAGEEKKPRGSRYRPPCFAWIFLQRHVTPRATTVPVVQKAFPVIPDCFGAIFVIFGLFNVLFVLC
jgi:hypothetical protein